MAEEETPKPTDAAPAPSAHFSLADNVEYEYEVDDKSDNHSSGEEEEKAAATARRRASSLRRSSIIQAQNFDVSYHPDKLILYSRPRQRQQWGDTQVLPRVNYGDLFFDLFFVAAAYNTGNILVDYPSGRGTLYFLATFFAIMGLWLDKAFYDSRFVVTDDDLFHRFFDLAVLVVLATAVLHIRPVDIMSNGEDYVDAFAFCLAILLGNALTAIKYIELYFWGIGQPVIKQEAKRYFKMGMIYLVPVLVATILAGVKYYGSSHSNASYYDQESYESKAESTHESPNGSDNYHRLLAGSTYPASHNEFDLPMYIILAGFIGRWLCLALDIRFCFPAGGRHKER